MAWRYRVGCLTMILLNSAVIGATVLGLKLLGQGIDYIRSIKDPTAPEITWLLPPPGDWTPMQVVAWCAGLVLLVALLGAVAKYWAAWTQAWVGQHRVVVDLRAQVYDKLQRLSFRFFDGNQTGSIINRVTTDVQGVREFLDTVVLQSVTMAVSLLVYLFCMLDLHVGLTVACLATTPFLWWLSLRFGREVKPAYRETRELADNVVRKLSENVQGVHVVKGFARQREQIAGFEESTAALRSQRFWIFGRLSRFTALIQILTQLNLMILLGFGGYLVIEGQLALGDGLIVFAGLLQQFSSQVANVANITNSIQNSMTGAQRVFEILDAPLEVANKPNARTDAVPEGHVIFDHVHFSYEPGGEDVLHDVSFEAKPGQCIAVLGTTGSGKSTLLSMISRFYDPTSGRVLVDGVDLRDLDIDSLRRRIGVVFQESFLFSNTVAENIAFGHPDATREQVERAAHLAAADEFIQELSDGYDTVIGERGANLSGGQRQRLAIARAMLTEPAILLLDDATAAVDPETEHEILQAMESAMAGRTTFVVAHRLSTLRQADRVIVLEKGRIIQDGSHEELMSDTGQYRRAADIQSPNDESRRLLISVFGGRR